MKQAVKHRASNDCQCAGWKFTLWVTAPATREAYIWNQWLKMSSINSARKAKCQRTYSIPSTVRSPAVDSLQKVAQEGWILREAQH